MNLRLTAALLLPAILTAMLAAGCSTAPPRRSEPPPAQIPATPADASRADEKGPKLVRIAAQFIGAPYRFGGSGPREFDCSGLVFFSHDRLGITVPRTAAEQQRAADPVDLNALEPGDLVFFRTGGRKVDHVGIYAGAGKFIHAPSTGQVVAYAYLEDPYYHRRFVSAGRLR